MRAWFVVTATGACLFMGIADGRVLLHESLAVLSVLVLGVVWLLIDERVGA